MSKSFLDVEYDNYQQQLSEMEDEIEKEICVNCGAEIDIEEKYCDDHCERSDIEHMNLTLKHN